MADPIHSLYEVPSCVRALEKLVDHFEDIYRKELEKDIKKVVGKEDWQVMPLEIIDENKPERLDCYFFALGFKYGNDAYGIGEIFPFKKKAMFNYDKKAEENKKEHHMGDILTKIEEVLKNKGYKVEYFPLCSMPKLNDDWKHKK